MPCPSKMISTQHCVIWHQFYSNDCSFWTFPYLQKKFLKRLHTIIVNREEQGKNPTRLNVGRVSLRDASTLHTEGADFFAQDVSVNWDKLQGITPYSSPWCFSSSSTKADRWFTNLSQLLLLFIIFQSHFSWLHHSGKGPTVTRICNLAHFLNAQPSVHPWIAMSWKKHTFLKNFLFEKWLKTGIWTKLRLWT